jgi:beta-glucosidase
LKDAGKNAPKFTAEDLKIIASPLDFVGINVYKPDAYVLASDNAPGWREIPYTKGHPMLSSQWHTMGPESMYWAPKFVQSLWNAKEIHITENGCATQDVIADDGKIYDTDRIMFLRAYLTQLQRATADGVPVKGYFQWSAMDNFEWTAGFGNRYGLVCVDFASRSARRNSVLRSSARRHGETPLPRSVNIRFLALTELLQFVGRPFSGGSRPRCEKGFTSAFDPKRTSSSS